MPRPLLLFPALPPDPRESGNGLPAQAEAAVPCRKPSRTLETEISYRHCEQCLTRRPRNDAFAFGVGNVCSLTRAGCRREGSWRYRAACPRARWNHRWKPFSTCPKPLRVRDSHGNNRSPPCVLEVRAHPVAGRTASATSMADLDRRGSLGPGQVIKLRQQAPGTRKVLLPNCAFSRTEVPRRQAKFVCPASPRSEPRRIQCAMFTRDGTAADPGSAR